MLPIPPGVDWALMRAFGPVEARCLPEIETAREHAANRLALRTRIVSRLPLAQLARELGETTAESWERQAKRQMAAGLAQTNARHRIRCVAEERGTPIVLLKFAALEAKGKVTVVSRRACDLDVLVGPRDVDALASALERQGFSRLRLRTVKHQPVVLRDQSGVALEIHVHIPYVHINGNTAYAELEELRAADLIEPFDSNSSWTFLPKDDLLFAHLIAHGIAQHGFEPQTYNPFRMVADLVDLGFDHGVAQHAAVLSAIGRSVSRQELEAMVPLTEALRTGQHRMLWDRNTDESRLLRHFVLTSLDEGYRARVILSRYRQMLDEVGFVAVLNEVFTAAFLLPESNLDKIYGGPTASPKLRRLVRPADFVLRGLRRLGQALKSRS
ncbi:MAG: nucleotidyltransferase family protein [Polyangiaceae bacterium]